MASTRPKQLTKMKRGRYGWVCGHCQGVLTTHPSTRFPGNTEWKCSACGRAATFPPGAIR